MAPELIYMLKVNVGIALFYAFYRLFCCRDTFFQWRRIALLGFLALSFLYPLLNIQNWVKEQPAIGELADYYAQLMMANSTATNATAATQTAASTLPMPDLMNLLALVYICGIIILSIRFVIQLLSIFHLALKSKEVTIDKVRIRSLSSPANPFSFWPWVFIYLPGLEENERREIMTHELTHIHQWHSIDVILSEIVNILCWMNPFMWLLKAEVRLNLEYLADHKVVESVADTRQYQYHLLGLANQNRQTGLYNNFNLSHLKNRIMMMNKKRTCTTGRIKYALFAPLTLALLLVSNIETVARSAERLIHPATEFPSPPKAADEGIPSGTPTAVYAGKEMTFHVTVTNSEGKPQANLVMLTKISGENKSFKTDANGKVDITLDMTNLSHAVMYSITPSKNPNRSIIVVLSPGNTEVTTIYDTEADFNSFVQADREIRIKLNVTGSDGQPVSGAKFLSSLTAQTAATNHEGMAELKIKVNEEIAISKQGYESRNFSPSRMRLLKDMAQPAAFMLYKEGEEQIYQIVEQMPEFPGGMKACLEFIRNSIQYPAQAKAKNIQGRTIVGCVIDKDGSISNVVTMGSSGNNELDAEALRIIKSMPKWTPGRQDGKAVRCRYNLPITFKLQ